MMALSYVHVFFFCLCLCIVSVVFYIYLIAIFILKLVAQYPKRDSLKSYTINVVSWCYITSMLLPIYCSVRSPLYLIRDSTLIFVQSIYQKFVYTVKSRVLEGIITFDQRPSHSPSAKVIFFYAGSTDFEEIPVYRRGFNTVKLHIDIWYLCHWPLSTETNSLLWSDFLMCIKMHFGRWPMDGRHLILPLL